MPSVGANVIIDNAAVVTGPSGGVPADAVLAEDDAAIVTEDDIFVVTEDGT